MKVCGIVAEYNPFHNGHLYHLSEAKKKTEADVMIVAMSGDFLQRGEPAIVDKWDRASVALRHGADIVVEIPAAFSVQPADIYARGAVDLLDMMGIDVLCFGSESGVGDDFIQAAEVFVENEMKINRLFQNEQQQQRTYAENMSDLLTRNFPELKLDLTQPNNMLGFAYAKALKRKNRQIDIKTIQRKGSQYHDSRLEGKAEIASATAIRNLIFSGESWQEVQSFPFPEETETILKASRLVHWDDFFPLLKYRIVTASLQELSQIYLMENGLEYRVKDCIKDASGMNDFLTRLKTRQLSWTRLQRLSYYILLDKSQKEMEERSREVEYARLLGFNDVGQQYLSGIKHRLTKPLITNISQKNNELTAYDITVGEVYRLVDQDKIKRQDYMRKPIKMD